MREITIYSLGECKQTVAGDYLRIVEARACGVLPHEPVQKISEDRYVVHDLPIFTVVADGEEYHFAVKPEVWDKLSCAVRGDLAQTKADLARAERRLIEALDRLDGFHASTRWRRLVMAWRNEL